MSRGLEETVRRLLMAIAMMLSAGVRLAGADAFTDLCREPSAPVLQVKDRNFLVDGQPKFAVLASYFDAMRAPDVATLQNDFGFLKSKGIDGIRILPLWVRDNQSTAPTLLDEDGRIRSDERWRFFVTILKTAAKCGFIVDVTFNRDGLAAGSDTRFTVDEYFGDAARSSCGSIRDQPRGITEVVCRLKSIDARHVLIDVQNERNHSNRRRDPAGGVDGMQLTDAQVQAIRNAVKGIDPGRIVTVSHTADDPGPPLAIAAAANLDVIAYHDNGFSGQWPENTPAEVRALEAGGRPVYLQENRRAPDVPCSGTGENPFINAVKAAKLAGAAAWTFHTSAAYRLDERAVPTTFQHRIASCAREAEFLNNFRAAVDRVP
jgi:hypothetical protein